MGLDMKFARLALLPIFFLALSSCLEVKQGALDYGPENDFDEVNAALKTPLAGSDPTNIKVGEFVHSAETQIINESFGFVISDMGLTVVERNESATEIALKLIENKITYSTNGEQRKSTTEKNAVIEKEVAAAVQVLAEGGAREGLRQFSDPEAAAAATTTPKIRRTFHNLKTGMRVIAPPPAVVNQANCGGIPNCQIRVYDIAFDVVDWESEEKAKKTSYEFSMSPDVPFLAQELNQCMTFLQALDAKRPDSSTLVKVKYCMPVVNFRFEAP